MKLTRSIVYVAMLGILFHGVGELLPRKWFHDEWWPFRSMRWEKNGKIYERLGIHAWKDKLPDMSKQMKYMVPKRLSLGATSAEVQVLIKETCVAEFIHGLLCVLSVGVYFIWENAIGVFLVVLCVVGNLPFILIQRYNRPHLQSLKRRMIRREERQDRCEC